MRIYRPLDFEMNSCISSDPCQSDVGYHDYLFPASAAGRNHILTSLSCTDSSGSPQLCEGIARFAKAVLAHDTDLMLNSATTSPTTSLHSWFCWSI
mmetsp:Transcript_120277/g.169244  ORF Transcript_120277/g.169244 Transcript_120277/m.169244 type:complete len:96 (-) Transcript_120277:154-441(-)